MTSFTEQRGWHNDFLGKLAWRILISLAAGFISFFLAMYSTFIIVGILLRQTEDNPGLGLIVVVFGFPIWLLTALAVALFVLFQAAEKGCGKHSRKLRHYREFGSGLF